MVNTQPVGNFAGTTNEFEMFWGIPYCVKFFTSFRQYIVRQYFRTQVYFVKYFEFAVFVMVYVGSAN